MSERPPKIERQPELTEEQGRILELEGVTHVEQPVTSSEGVRHSLEYRKELEELQERYRDDKRMKVFLSWLEKGIDYLEYPFRYADSFGTDGASHRHRKDWEWKVFTEERGTSDLLNVWNKVQISKNNISAILNGVLLFAPDDFKGTLGDLPERMENLLQKYFVDTMDSSEKSTQKMIEEAPYLDFSLEKKKAVVQQVVDLVHELIGQSLEFYAQRSVEK